MAPSLPKAVYIGYQKTGSTFLRSYFAHHPEIEFTRQARIFRFAQNEGNEREHIDSFQAKPNTPCWVDMHEGLATGVILLRGQPVAEKRFTPFEFPDPSEVEQDIEKVAKNIHEANPKAKIIITIRCQAEWLESNWLHFFRSLPKRQNGFTDFLNTYEGQTLLRAGNFDLTIRSFQNLFGKGQVLVLPLEYISAKQKEALQLLCKFLELTYVPFDWTAQDKNRGRDQVDIFLERYARPLGGSRFLKGVYNSVRPAKNWITGRFHKDLISPEATRLIRSFYAESNRQTSELIGTNLGDYGYW